MSELTRVGLWRLNSIREKEKPLKKESKPERVLARALAEKELMFWPRTPYG